MLIFAQRERARCNQGDWKWKKEAITDPVFAGQSSSRSAARRFKWAIAIVIPAGNGLRRR
jgi:hypothetical protein